MLLLYSSLLNGEEINKTIFCFENDCSPRSFDRDIEDIRLFLSESLVYWNSIIIGKITPIILRG